MKFCLCGYTMYEITYNSRISDSLYHTSPKMYPLYFMINETIDKGSIR